jgi:hypothetical protein
LRSKKVRTGKPEKLKISIALKKQNKQKEKKKIIAIGYSSALVIFVLDLSNSSYLIANTWKSWFDCEYLLLHKLRNSIV